jgi:hypothetical protein
MRCCVTKYRDVFDYQAELDVQVIFPQGSELVGNQTESFRVVFSGTANAPDVAIEQLTGRTKYEIDVKDIQGRQAVLLMKVKPLSYPIQEVGELSVTGLKLAIRANESAYVSFADVGQRETLETEYALMVRDEAGNVETSLTVLANTLVDQKIELPQKLSLRRTHIVELVVTRSGQGLSQDLTFSKTMIRRR